MKQIEVARLAYDVAFVQRSVEGVRELVAEDFTWRQRAEWPGRSDYTIEEIPQLWADLDDTYTEYNLLPVEFVDVALTGPERRPWKLLDPRSPGCSAHSCLRPRSSTRIR